MADPAEQVVVVRRLAEDAIRVEVEAGRDASSFIRILVAVTDFEHAQAFVREAHEADAARRAAEAAQAV